MSSGRLGRRTMLPALALAMSCVCALLVAGAAFAAPSGLTVAVQKDSSDAPLYAAIAWTADPSASAYEVQKATIHSQSEARQWVTVTIATTTAPDGRVTGRDSYEVGSGVCYRVRTVAPAASEFTPEACSPIPPTSSAPAPPNTGNASVEPWSSSSPSALFWGLIAAGFIGTAASGLAWARSRR